MDTKELKLGVLNSVFNFVLYAYIYHTDCTHNFPFIIPAHNNTGWKGKKNCSIRKMEISCSRGGERAFDTILMIIHAIFFDSFSHQQKKMYLDCCVCVFVMSFLYFIILSFSLLRDHEWILTDFVQFLMALRSIDKCSRDGEFFKSKFF